MQFPWFSKLSIEKSARLVSIVSPVFYVPSLVSAIRKYGPALRRLKVPLPAHAIFGSFLPGSFWVACFIMCGLVLLVNLWHGALSRAPSWCSIPRPLAASSISPPGLRVWVHHSQLTHVASCQCSFWLFCGWRVQVLCLAVDGEERQRMPCLILLSGWRSYCRRAKCKLNACN